MKNTSTYTPDELVQENCEGIAFSPLNSNLIAFLSKKRKEDESVILYGSNFLQEADRDRLQKGSIVGYDLWRSKGRLQARRIWIKSDPTLSKSIRGLVTDWHWKHGYIEIGTNTLKAHGSTLTDCDYLSPGDVVDVNLNDAGEIARISKTSDWDDKNLSQYERDLAMGAPTKWIKELRQIIDPNERWDVKNRPESSILRSYFKFTYLRQQEIPEHLIKSGQKMCWNTGLMDKNGVDVLAEFEEVKYSSDQIGPKYKWLKFLTKEDRSATAWRGAPRAKYWESGERGELIYDTEQGDPTIQSDHILERIDDRFPEEMRNWPRTDVVRAVQEAAKDAVNRVRQNYKTAIPQYYRSRSGQGKGSIQLLLPLKFIGQPRPSLALAVRRDGDAYYAATVLKIEWAYTYARLLTKPDTEWLNPFEQQDQSSKE
jgi:hypothetical protein